MNTTDPLQDALSGLSLALEKVLAALPAHNPSSETGEWRRGAEYRGPLLRDRPFDHAVWTHNGVSVGVPLAVERALVLEQQQRAERAEGRADQAEAVVARMRAALGTIYTRADAAHWREGQEMRTLADIFYISRGAMSDH